MMVGRGPVNRGVDRAAAWLLALVALALAGSARAEDGPALWLRYAPLEGEARQALDDFNPRVEVDAVHDDTGMLEAAVSELHRGLTGLLDHAPEGEDRPTGLIELSCGTDASNPDGHFSIRSTGELGRPAIAIEAGDHLGCLYGSLALLRELSLGKDPTAIRLDERPAMPLRLLNHWDNPDGTVERGYSGRSIFDWWRLPEHLDQRLVDYARANASVGINGTVVNNVNASPLFLSDRYIPKLKRVADALRPYGIHIYISARFSAPQDVCGQPSADPHHTPVQTRWKAPPHAHNPPKPDKGR
jgi:alpha-glucuronidase